MRIEKELSLDFQVAIKDAVYEGRTDDYVLASLLSLTIEDLADEKMFINPLEEPIFYGRYFKKWVKDAVLSLDKLKQAQENAK